MTLEELLIDIATVRVVAQRRSDPDRDHRLMIARLLQWEKAIADALAKSQDAGL